MNPHPLQAALDRSSRALRTVTDLVEIAKARKSPGGRSDARQLSLYRAIVAASVGSVEESTEALVTEALRAQGFPALAMPVLEVTISRMMQTPHTEGIGKLMRDFIQFDPRSSIQLRLRTSRPAYRERQLFAGRHSHQIWTMYDQDRIWTGQDAEEVWNRFVKIRHSFAHQDSSTPIFTKPEVKLISDCLSSRKANSPNEIAFVEKLNATCAVRIFESVSSNQDPVRDWRLHETHAINALLASASVVSSMTDGLADDLNQTGTVIRSQFDPLHLDIEKGAWVSLAGPALATSPCGIGWTLVPYKPGSRTA